VAAVVGIVLLAAAARLWNIGAGIPNGVGQDEPHIMDRVVRMMKTGDFNPHFFDWPSLTFYLNLIVTVGAFVLGSMRGAWSHLDQVSADQFYLAGRQFTALIGTATVALTFAAGRRWSLGVAVFAAAFMAVMPNSVRESHYVLTDTPTAFFTTLALVLSLRAGERGTRASVLGAALTAGLAASCKYNGAMAVVFPIIAVIRMGGGWSFISGRIGLVAAAAAAGFIVGTPYAVLDLPAFLNDYARLAAVFARERHGDPGWSIYLKHFSNSVSMVSALVVGFGLVAVLVRGVVRQAERGPALMLLAFVAIYFTVMAGSYQIYARYLLPLLPPLAIAGGVGVMSIVGWVRPRVASRWAPILTGGVLSALVLTSSVMSVVALGRGGSKPSTIAQAYEWILKNVPAGSKVAIEYGATRLPDRYPVVAARLFVARTIEDYRQQGVQYFLAAAPEYQGTLTNPGADPGLTERYRVFFAGTRLVASFDPTDRVGGPPVRIFQIIDAKQ